MAAAGPRSFREALFDPPDAKVDVVFVDGFGSDGAGKQSSTTAWPPELLAKLGEIVRIFLFGYKSNLHDFYPEANHTGRTIDVHSAELLRGLNDGRKAGTDHRPIFFVARDFGGLVCANALSLRDANKGIINNTCGLVFLETPFEGKATAKWAKVATEIPPLVGLAKPNNLKERSKKLVNINEEFLKFLNSRKTPLKIQCFYDKYESTPLPGLDLYEVSDEKYGNMADLLVRWIKEFSAPPADDEGRQDSVQIGDTVYHGTISGNSGVVMGSAYTPASDGIRISGASMYRYYGDGRNRSPPKDEDEDEHSIQLRY